MSLLALVGVDPLLLVGGVLVGLLLVLSHLTRRIRGGRAGGRETVALTGQHAIHVVEIAGRRMLIGTGPSGAPQVLAELGEVEASSIESQPTLARPWAEVLVPRRRDFDGSRRWASRLWREARREFGGPK